MRVELSGVHVNRDKKPILRDFGLTTEENEYLVILGGNGVGKTTTLRTIVDSKASTQATFYLEVNRLLIYHRGNAPSPWFFKTTHFFPI